MNKSKKELFFLYAAMLACLLSVSFFLFARSDFFTVAEIQAVGLTQLKDGDILRLVSGAEGENLFLIEEESLARKAELHPMVAKATVKKDFPSRLIVSIEERRPAAFILKEDSLVEIDDHGVILRIYESWPKKDLPVLTGISLEDAIGPGQRILTPSLTKALTILGQVPEEIEALLGEVNINDLGQVTVYLTTGVEVRLGQREDYAEKLLQLEEVVTRSDGYKEVEALVKYIDLTSSKPVLGR